MKTLAQDMVAPGDRELVQRVLVLDDRNAYTLLVKKHQQSIRAYLTRLTRVREIADDLAQETFLLGYRRIAQLKDHGKFLAWIYSIAHTQFLMWVRAQKGVETEAFSSETEVASHDGLEMADRMSAKMEAEEVLRDMKPEERSALVLCLAHDFTHTEAAEILGMPVGTIKSLIFRARQKLGVSHG